MTKLTTKSAVHAPIKEIEYKLADGGGLFLRVRASGAKSWLYCFRLPENRSVQRMTLGSVNDIPLKEARGMLPELRAQVSQGIDPRNTRAAKKSENAQAISMQKLFEGWIEFIKIAAEVTPRWIKRHEDRWRLHLQKSLAGILARDLSRAHLASALDAMTRKGIKEETRKALTTLNLMLDYGLTRHFIEHNPARVLKPKDFSATAGRSRDRALPLDELTRLWKALDQAQTPVKKIASTSVMAPMTSTAIKLLILTGARRGEVAAMRWDEVDLTSGVWSIPSTKTKNRQAHTIHLSPLALSLLESLKPLTDNAAYVFFTGRSNDHIHTDSLNTALKRLRDVSLFDLKHFTIHDLRRSAATAWGEHLKVEPHVIERMLNHQPLNKLVATYQRAVYAEEQKSAWLSWSGIVEQTIKVVA